MKRITIYVSDDNIMAHLPNNQIKFLTFIQFLRLAWEALRNNVEVRIEETK
jgi:hypothetical protein